MPVNLDDNWGEACAVGRGTAWCAEQCSEHDAIGLLDRCVAVRCIRARSDLRANKLGRGGLH